MELRIPQSHTMEERVGPSKDYDTGQRGHHRLCRESPRKCLPPGDLFCWEAPGWAQRPRQLPPAESPTANGEARSIPCTFLPPKTKLLQNKTCLSPSYFTKRKQDARGRCRVRQQERGCTQEAWCLPQPATASVKPGSLLGVRLALPSSFPSCDSTQRELSILLTVRLSSLWFV